jgi:hypothetical protein
MLLLLFLLLHLYVKLLFDLGEPPLDIIFLFLLLEGIFLLLLYLILNNTLF